MAARLLVTVRRVLEDGSEAAADGVLAAALEDSAEQFSGLLTWAAEESRYLDHGEREEAIGREGRELERRLLQATFRLDAALEERAPQVTSAAGVRHRTVEAGQERGLASVFGPVRVTRMAYRHGHQENLYPADARSVMPADPYSMGMRALAAFHLASAGYGQAQEIIRDRTGVRIGHAQLAGIARDLAAWTGDFYQERSRDAEEEDQPDGDVIMMQGDGKGIAMRPEHRRNAGKDDGIRPGIKKMAEIVAVADFTPAVREPEDIAAPPARRKAHPGPKARDKWVSASVTESIEDMIGSAFDEADRRDPERVRQRVFLVDGNKQQISAIEAHAGERGLKVPVLIDYIHVLELSTVSARKSYVFAGHIVVAIDAALFRRCGLRVPSAAGELAPEFQVLAVGLLERGPQGRGLVAVLFLEVGDLAGQRLDDRVVAAGPVRRGRFRAGLAAESFDPGAEVGVSVEKGVGDAGFALDGLEGDRLAALDQGADGGLGGLRLGF